MRLVIHTEDCPFCHCGADDCPTPIEECEETGGRMVRIIQGTGTYVDGSEYYGPEEFEAEHGMTFAEYCDTLDAPDKGEQEGRLYRDK